MIIKLDKCNIEDETYHHDKRSWCIPGLIAASKDLEVFDLPLAHIDIGVSPWRRTSTISEIADHAKRMMDCDLKYPVIMSANGYIMNGWHRVLKALVTGKETVKAVRFIKDPPYDFTEE